jgi:hypothetical protein
VGAQPAPPALPFKQYQALGSATSGFPIFMNSGGSIVGLPTICMAGQVARG